MKPELVKRKLNLKGLAGFQHLEIQKERECQVAALVQDQL